VIDTYKQGIFYQVWQATETSDFVQVNGDRESGIIYLVIGL